MESCVLRCCPLAEQATDDANGRNLFFMQHVVKQKTSGGGGGAFDSVFSKLIYYIVFVIEVIRLCSWLTYSRSHGQQTLFSHSF